MSGLDQHDHGASAHDDKRKSSSLSPSTYALFAPTSVLDGKVHTGDMSGQQTLAHADEERHETVSLDIVQPMSGAVPAFETTTKVAISDRGGVNSDAQLSLDDPPRQEPGAMEKLSTIIATSVANAGTSATNAADNIALSIGDSAGVAMTNVQGGLVNAQEQLLAIPVIEATTQQVSDSFSPDSHQLAQRDYGKYGAIQGSSSTDAVVDHGWHRPVIEIPDPLIGGVPNGQLFSMIRRFNQDVFDVRALPQNSANGLDLKEAWSTKHATDKMTLNLERFYLSVFLSLANFGKHVSRLRSWKEKQRTGMFCLTYTLAWSLDLLVPLFLGTLILLVSSTEARDTLFPPVPLALVNLGTGGLQKPQAGQLGTTNTITGAPEKVEGEAVEEEAANFVENLRHLLQKAIGVHESQTREGDPLEKKIPQPIKNVVNAVKSGGSAPGHTSAENNVQTQQPMEEILWDKLSPEQIAPIFEKAPFVVGEFVDTWECMANALCPTPPFDQLNFLRIDALLAPAFIASLFISYYAVYKILGLMMGVILFGQPILDPTIRWLDTRFPCWRQALLPKHNILKGVPTNRQLTLSLLRIGEAHKAPIPPAPTSTPADANIKRHIDVDSLPLNATTSEVIQAIEPSDMDKSHPQRDQPSDDGAKHKKLSRFVRYLKGSGKAIVETKMAIDHVRVKTKIGSKEAVEKAKGELGVLPKTKNLIYAGPIEYKARYDGKEGWIYVSNETLLFSSGSKGDRASPIVCLEFRDIEHLARKAAWSGKVLSKTATWSSQDDLLPSIEIGDVKGKVFKFTALPERDALFNRLIAIGNHFWVNI